MIIKKNHFTRRLLLTCASALFIASPLQAALEVIDEPAGTAELKVMGDVKTVLDGVSTGTHFLRVEPTDFLAALGCASIYDDPTSLGETLIFSGQALVKSVDEQTSYATERTANNAWTSFLAGLTPQSKPVARYRIQGAEPISVDALYKQLHHKHGALIAITGRAHFPVLNLSAVKRAPVYGEPILGPKRAEYFHPTETVAKADVFFFGLSLRSNADANDVTKKVFYINPADELGTAGQSHTHCGILKADIAHDNDGLVSADSIESVAHILTQSRMESGEISVYELVE